MMARGVLYGGLWLGLAAGCGGDKAPDSGDTTGTGTTDTDGPTDTDTDLPTGPTDTGTSCSPGGEVVGCVLNGALCDGKTYEENYVVGGGWFVEVDDGRMTVVLQPNDRDEALSFDISAPDIAPGVSLEIPFTVNAEIQDTTDPELTEVQTGCEGMLRITEYTEGVSLSGEWILRAEVGPPPCDTEQFYTTSGSFTALVPCVK
jgi:hypothetical protein